MNGAETRPEPACTEPKLEIHSVLMASTSHITEQDKDRLEDEPKHLLRFSKGDDGWLVHVPEVGTAAEKMITTMTREGYSAAFVRVIEFAVTQKCQWLMLDSDGPKIPGLPTFD